MKTFLFFALCFIFMTPLFSQSALDFSSVLLKAEQNPQITNNALKLAIEKNLPTSIFISEEVFIQPVIVYNNEVLYSVITDLKHPFNGGYLATFGDIEKKYDLSIAKITYYSDHNISNNNLQQNSLADVDSLYLIPESTNDRIMAFNTNGVLVDSNFIQPHTTNDTINTPIEALFHNVRNSIIVSDQSLDVVQEFNTTGNFMGTFAPADGQATDTLDNIRGMAFHPNGNLLVTVAEGPNSDAIAEFDLFGNYVGNFIAPNDSLMDSPFDVLIRSNDVLIPAITSNGVYRYDLSGNYIDDFATGIVFPEQVVELSSGEIAVANFKSPNSGIQIYPAGGGNFTQLLTGVTGNRGVAELDNGNLLTTNGSGVYIIERSTGNLVQTLVSGVEARFISLYVVEQNQNIPIFSAFPTTIDFGSVIEDSTKTDSILVSNQGNGDLFISSVVSDNSNLVVYPDNGFISSNNSMIFYLEFTSRPDSIIQNASIVFNHNGVTSPDTILATATVITGLNKLSNVMPAKFNLSQNYPNPFNPITNFKFSLPVSENVVLKIYNINGQEIDTLIKRRLAAGEYNRKYNASTLPSGIYIYTVRAGDFSQSKKMIFIK